MAVRLSEMKARTKIITVPWDGETVDVSYYPNVVTPELLEDVESASQKEDLSVLGVMLAPVIEWWDVLDDNGQRIPASEENIRRTPMSFINALQKAVQEAQNPPESGGSAGG